MEMKNVVLTAAIALACSAFADGTVKQSWFDPTPAESGTFDTLVSTPVSVACPGAPASGVAVYRIIATIEDLKVFAAEPDGPATVSDKTAKASICAIDGKWYGYSNSDWVELTGITAPVEDRDYTIKIEYYPASYKVKYVVGNESSGELAPPTGFNTAVPSIAAFAGTGEYTSVVCEYEVTIPDNNKAVTVDNVGGKIIISDAALKAMGVENPGVATDEQKSDAAKYVDPNGNGLANWVNYVLNITNPTENNKPYAAPVQNGEENTLTFNLGGVGNVLGETTTGAKVTYTVETLSSVDPTPVVDGTATEPTPVGPGSSISVNVPSGVKYYRIKIKIDPAK